MLVPLVVISEAAAAVGSGYGINMYRDQFIFSYNFSTFAARASELITKGWTIDFWVQSRGGDFTQSPMINIFPNNSKQLEFALIYPPSAQYDRVYGTVLDYDISVSGYFTPGYSRDYLWHHWGYTITPINASGYITRTLYLDATALVTTDHYMLTPNSVTDDAALPDGTRDVYASFAPPGGLGYSFSLGCDLNGPTTPALSSSAVAFDNVRIWTTPLPQVAIAAVLSAADVAGATAAAAAAGAVGAEVVVAYEFETPPTPSASPLVPGRPEFAAATPGGTPVIGALLADVGASATLTSALCTSLPSRVPSDAAAGAAVARRVAYPRTAFVVAVAAGGAAASTAGWAATGAGAFSVDGAALMFTAAAVSRLNLTGPAGEVVVVEVVADPAPLAWATRWSVVEDTPAQQKAFYYPVRDPGGDRVLTNVTTSPNCPGGMDIAQLYPIDSDMASVLIFQGTPPDYDPTCAQAGIAAAPNAYGADVIKVAVQAWDTQGQRAAETGYVLVDVTPVNDEPDLLYLGAKVAPGAEPPLVLREDTPATFSLGATDADPRDTVAFVLTSLPPVSAGVLQRWSIPEGGGPGRWVTISRLNDASDAQAVWGARALGYRTLSPGYNATSALIGPPDAEVDWMNCYYYFLADNCDRQRIVEPSMFASEWVVVEVSEPLYAIDTGVFELGRCHTVSVSAMTSPVPEGWRNGSTVVDAPELMRQNWSLMWSQLRGVKDTTTSDTHSTRTGPVGQCTSMVKSAVYLVEFDSCSCPDWTCVDAFQVVGTKTPSTSAIPTDTPLRFVPAADFNGNTSFSFSLSDCLGNPTRTLASRTWTFSVTPVDDPPVLYDGGGGFGVPYTAYSEVAEVVLLLHDVDNVIDPATATVQIDAAPLRGVAVVAPLPLGFAFGVWANASIAGRVGATPVAILRYHATPSQCSEALTDRIRLTGAVAGVPTNVLAVVISGCTPSPPAPFPVMTAVAAIVGGGCGLLICVGTLVVLAFRWWRRRQLILPETRAPPTGTVAMVFTDVQDSTVLWEALGETFKVSLDLHDSVQRQCIHQFNGYEVKTEGDAFFVAFDCAHAALAWALGVQRALLVADWDPQLLEFLQERGLGDGTAPQGTWRGLRVRMGMHVGLPMSERNPMSLRMDYFGPEVNLSARVQGMGRGGQILVSPAIHAMLAGGYDADSRAACPGCVALAKERALQGLPPVEDVLDGVSFVAHGPQKLKGIAQPVPLFEARMPDLQGRVFPPMTGVVEGVTVSAVDKFGGDVQAAISKRRPVKRPRARAGATRVDPSLLSAHVSAERSFASSGGGGAQSLGVVDWDRPVSARSHYQDPHPGLASVEFLPGGGAGSNPAAQAGSGGAGSSSARGVSEKGKSGEGATIGVPSAPWAASCDEMTLAVPM